MIRPLLICLALALTPGLASAQIVTTGPVTYDSARVSVEWGVYCETPTIGSQSAPDTAAGQIDILAEVPDFIWSTHQVPAYPGMSFGVKTTERSGAGIPVVTVRLTHPPLLESGVTEQTYTSGIASGGAVSINSYTFDFPEELVTGTWTLEAYDTRGLIYRVEFDVVPPETLPGIAGNCPGTFLS